MNHLISSGNVINVLGIHRNTLNRMVNALTEGFKYRRGAGVEAHFTFRDFFAMYVGIAYREENASYERAMGITRFLSSLSIERIEADLKAGKVLPVPTMTINNVVVPGFLTEVPGDLNPAAKELLERLDLRKLYSQAVKLANQTVTNPKVQNRGRKAGKPHRPQKPSKPTVGK